MKLTQGQKILQVLENLRDGLGEYPIEYIRVHPAGSGISARYFKQVMLISECNGRISELRGKGHNIETSKEKDRYGFAYHRLAPEKKLTMGEWFDSL